MSDSYYLKIAIAISRQSVEEGNFPVGAIVVLDEEIIGRGKSNGKNNIDATAHAEINAIRDAEMKIGTRDIKNSIVYSSMEPCLMCFSASYWAKVKKIVFAVRKDILPKVHYEGLHNLNLINEKNNRKIEIVHIQELEEKALEVIKDWEKKKTN